MEKEEIIEEILKYADEIETLNELFSLLDDELLKDILNELDAKTDKTKINNVSVYL